MVLKEHAARCDLHLRLLPSLERRVEPLHCNPCILGPRLWMRFFKRHHQLLLAHLLLKFLRKIKTLRSIPDIPSDAEDPHEQDTDSDVKVELLEVAAPAPPDTQQDTQHPGEPPQQPPDTSTSTASTARSSSTSSSSGSRSSSRKASSSTSS